jgi:YD repeat-containing protein
MLVLEDGDYLFFDRVSSGTSYSDAIFQHTETSTRFYKAMTEWNGDGWTPSLTDGTKIEFPEAYGSTNMAQGAATAIRDGQGNKLELVRDGQRNLMEIRTPHGRKMKFKCDEQSRIARPQHLPRFNAGAAEFWQKSNLLLPIQLHFRWSLRGQRRCNHAQRRKNRSRNRKLRAGIHEASSKLKTMRNRSHMFRTLLWFGFGCAIVAILAATAKAQGQAVPHHGRVRVHFIAAEEVEWDFAPSCGTKQWATLSASLRKLMSTRAPLRIGRIYKKAIYHEYTDAKFNRLMPRGRSTVASTERSCT